MGQIKDFYKRARAIIEKEYDRDNDQNESSFLDARFDALGKEFDTDELYTVVLQYDFDTYEPDDIASDCLEVGMVHEIIDHTEVVCTELNKLFVVIVVKNTKE